MKAYNMLVMLMVVISPQVASSDVCRDKISLGTIDDYKVISRKAGTLAKEFRGIRDQRDLSKKLLKTLKKLVDLNAIMKSHSGKLNIWKEILGSPSKGFSDEEIQAYVNATEVEFARLREAIARARSLKAEHKLSKLEIHDLEFSINGILDTTITRLNGTSEEAKAEAKGHLSYCLHKEGDLSVWKEIETTTKGMLVVLKDWMLFGLVVNPLRSIGMNGKYNMSVTRIEYMNRKHTSPANNSGSAKATR